VKNTYMIVEPSKDPTAGYIATTGDGAVKQITYPS
jgi:hypothetical protein